MATAPKTEEKTKEKTIAPKEPDRIVKYAPETEEDWQIGDTGDERMYYLCEPGNVIQGRVSDTDMFEGQDGEPRVFLKVQTTHPTKVVLAKKKGEEKGEEKIAPKGSLVWLGVRHGLLGLHTKLESSPVVLEIAVKPKDKVPIPGTAQTVWRFAWASRPTKNRRVIAQKPISQEEESDIPF